MLQTAGLGLAGSLAGIALGSLVQMAFPFFLARYFQVTMAPRFDVVSALQGLAVGLLTVLLFTVPPLLGIRHIRPALIFRREMAAPPAGIARVVEARRGVRYLGIRDPRVRRSAGGWLSENARTGVYFAIAMAAGLASLALVAWVLLRGLRCV